MVFIIFVSGIHGVGKTYFCNMIEKKLGIKNYSASQLIAGRREKGFSADKFVSDIDDNQVPLLDGRSGTISNRSSSDNKSIQKSPNGGKCQCVKCYYQLIRSM